MAVMLWLSLLTAPVQAAPGDLDTSFNGTGIVAGVSKDVIVLRNGRIVVASDGFSLTQYLPNDVVEKHAEGSESGCSGDALTLPE